MKPILKIRLVRNIRFKDSKVTDPQVIAMGAIDNEQIIDALIGDGHAINKDEILNFLEVYNRKAAEFASSGYSVNTGLVKMSSMVKGIIYDKKWNKFGNKHEVKFEAGPEINNVLHRTEVEIAEDLSGETTDMSDSNHLESRDNGKYLVFNDETPACGIAFRKWLCKSV